DHTVLLLQNSDMGCAPRYDESLRRVYVREQIEGIRQGVGVGPAEYPQPVGGAPDLLAAAADGAAREVARLADRLEELGLGGGAVERHGHRIHRQLLDA